MHVPEFSKVIVVLFCQQYITHQRCCYFPLNIFNEQIQSYKCEQACWQKLMQTPHMSRKTQTNNTQLVSNANIHIYGYALVLTSHMKDIKLLYIHQMTLHQVATIKYPCSMNNE